MKRLFPFIFSLFLIFLSYLIYSHWFSTSRPVPYYPPAENNIPEHLTSLKLVNVFDKETVVYMKDAPITVFAAVPYMPDNNALDYYSYLENKKGILKDIRIIYLWNLGKPREETINYVKKAANDDPNGQNILTNQILAYYQDKNKLEIATFPTFFAYDRQGNLVFKSKFIQKDALLSQLMTLY